MSKVADLSLAAQGKLKIEWAQAHMPVMAKLVEKYSATKPLEGMRVAGCLHVTKETAVLVKSLVAAGAEVSWSGCNPLSTQDDIAAALAEEGVDIYAWRGLSTEEFYWCIEQTLKFRPTLTLDDGADLIVLIHNKHKELLEDVVGGTEETTTGIHRLKAMADAGDLKYPLIAVNNAQTKWDFDNVYGTGQSSLDGILRASNILLAGKTFVVAGYGHCGTGIAFRASGMGSNVVVTEIDAVKALRAKMDGFSVMPMDEAAKVGDIFITATGMKDVIVGKHFESMKDGAIVCNTGHYDVELNLPELKSLSVERREVRPNNAEYVFENGKKIFVLAEGRLVNLSAAEGHPSEVMDMSFANQFLSLIRLAREGKNLENKVYDVSLEQDALVAETKLEAMGVKIDKLSPEQVTYFTDYNAGT